MPKTLEQLKQDAQTARLRQDWVRYQNLRIQIKRIEKKSPGSGRLVPSQEAQGEPT